MTDYRKELKVLVASRYSLSRKAVVALVSSLDGVRVVGEAGSGEETLAQVTELRPDVVLLEMNFADFTGGRLAAGIKAADRNIGVVSLSGPEEDNYTYLSPEVGIDVYVSKSASKQELLEILKKVDAGGNFYERKAGKQKITGCWEIREEEKKYSQKLTEREKQVLSFIVQGDNNQEISEQLNISQKTVKCHLYNIYKKLTVNNRVQAVLKALKLNICRLGDRKLDEDL
ncbi:MAG: LuxR C-terminal-related transcriptional regulator [Halanaerobiaceae bacterium]